VFFFFFCLTALTLSLSVLFSVFAYVGGLVVFLSTFYRIVMHYLMRIIFLTIGWLKRRRTGQQNELAEDLTTIASNSHDDTAISPYEYMEESGDDPARLEEPRTIVSVSSSGDLVDAMT